MISIPASRVVPFSILLAMVVWTIDALLDAVFFYAEGSFLDLLIFNIPAHEFYIRLVILVSFILFGFWVFLVLRHKEILLEDIRKNREEIALLNKEMEAINYSVSQDLKVPLRHIEGYALLLQQSEQSTLSDADAGHLENIQKATLRMRGMVENLMRLSSARIFNLKREEVDLGMAAQEIIRDLQAWDPFKPVSFRIDQRIIVTGDELLLRILLHSLLITMLRLNGRQAMTFSARMSDELGEVYELALENARDHLASFQESLKRAKHMELHLDEENIGIVVARHIVEKHKGTLWAEATDDMLQVKFTLGTG